MKARLIIVLSILGCIFSLSDTNILFDCEYGKEYVVDMTSLTEGYIPDGATLFFRLPIDTSNKSSITIKLLNEADYPSSLDVYFFSEKPSDVDAKNPRGSYDWVHRDSKEKDKTYTKYIYPIKEQYTGNYIVVTFRVYEDYHYFSFLVSPTQEKGDYIEKIEYNKEHIIENINKKSNYANNNNNNRNKNNNNQKDEGFISKYLLWPIRAILGACREKREVDEEEENRIFHLLPNKIKDSRRFYELIKKRVGIIIFYKGNNVQYLTNFINLLSRNTMMINLLKKNFCIYPLLANTNEENRMQNAITDYQMLYPSFVFCHNPSNRQRGDYTDNNLDRTCVINILYEEITMEMLNNILLDCVERLGVQYNSDNLGTMTDAEVLEQQKIDMENLEKLAQKREEELKKEKILEEERKKKKN